MSRYGMLLLAGASLAVFETPAFAQSSMASAPEAQNLAEVVVTARRRDEALQEVPQTIDVVTSAEIEKLNIRNFGEIQAVVPGLTLTGGGSGFSSAATVRGVAFNAEASGNNQTVEFYLNDAPISANFVFQSLFDVGQFELLRGPQGTLRGRASPSGSITVSTRRPTLSDFGGAINLTSADSNSYKGDFAVNVPIIRDVLGIRIAGVYDDNDGNQVHSIKQGDGFTEEPLNRTKAIRASARWEPTDWASINLMYQDLRARGISYNQVISSTFVTGAAPTASRVIGADDRASIQDFGTYSGQKQETWIGNVELRFAGQKLNYVGSWNEQDFYSLASQDPADYFNTSRFPLQPRQFRDPANNEQVCIGQSARADFTPNNQAYFQCTHGIGRRESHEIRLSSEQRIAGIFDYVVGALHDRNVPTTRLTQETPVLSNPTTVGSISVSPVVRLSRTTEKSIFGNLTAHIGEKLELSGGLRYIDFTDFSSILTSGVRPTPDRTKDYTKTIYSGSLKYRIAEDVMAYGLIGTSWRPGAFAVGNFNLRPTPREISFFDLPPETSTSYELGLKTVFMDNRGQLNLSIFRQEFENYVYRGPNVPYINYQNQGGAVRPSVNNFNFVAAVPATVNGVEADAAFQIMPRWSISGNFAYAKGEIENGHVACLDLNGDGHPDLNAGLPTLAQLQAAVGPGENVGACSLSGPTLTGPKWSASIQTERGFSLADNVDGFVRGLLTYKPDSEGDPNNTNDDVDAYALLNVYAGIRSPEGSWEVTFFAKNLFETERFLSVGGAPVSASIRSSSGNINHVSDYYAVTSLTPREIGINVRYAFGSR